MTKLSRIFLLLSIMLVVAACRQDATVSTSDLNLSVVVTDSLVGSTTVVVSVTQPDGERVENAGTLVLRGDMDHAGMTPVIVEMEQTSDGFFMAPFEWTMGGAWTLEATVTLPNGDTLTETFDYEIATEAVDDTADADAQDADDTETDADASEDSEMDMGGETSAVYMSITNNGDDRVTITGATTEIANVVELHETIVENDVARMKPVDIIEIDAGETVELRPGGIHIMLIDLTQGVAVDDTVAVDLTLESGDTVSLSAIVQDMMMDDLDGETVVGDLTFMNVWARPARAAMNHSGMDMGDSEEMDVDAEDGEMDMGDGEEMDMDAEDDAETDTGD